jgi:hypothetical protein
MTAALSQQAPNGAVFKARGLSDSLRKDFILIAAQTDYFSTIARWAIICCFPWGMRSKTGGSGFESLLLEFGIAIERLDGPINQQLAEIERTGCLLPYKGPGRHRVRTLSAAVRVFVSFHDPHRSAALRGILLAKSGPRPPFRTHYWVTFRRQL